MALRKRISTSSSTHTTAERLTMSLSHGRRASTRITSTTRPLHTANDHGTTTQSRPRTSRSGATTRPRTGASTLGAENQDRICAVSESRGISPIVGLAFVNLDTGEAVLSQISDSQTYVRTVHKLTVFNPSNILIVRTSEHPRSKLFSILEDSLDELINCKITLLDRHYWAETSGLEYIRHLAFQEDVESIKTAVSGNYYAVCCFAAVLKFTENALGKTFPNRSLRIKYEPPEGSMMIDLATISSLELVQNLQNVKSRDCLFGLLNETRTPMGARLLRSNILQPLTDSDVLNTRFDALEELSTKEEMFYAVREALKPCLDADKILTQLILTPTQPTLKDMEQSVNNVLMLKHYVLLIKSIWEALTGARSTMLQEIRRLCDPEHVVHIIALIDNVLNEDTTYVKRPLDLRNQRTYAVKSGIDGLLDVARQTYKESMADALQHIADIGEEHGLLLHTKYDNVRQFYLRLAVSDVDGGKLPAVFINIVKKRDIVECQTLDLVQRNRKISDSHNEVILMSDRSVRELIGRVREYMSILFKVCEAIAMLDMISSFVEVVTSQDYVRPALSETLAIRAGRHPIREKIHNMKIIPNDVYATKQTRFQIITGVNMSGKSTYIRTVALMTIMAQIGCFVPADYAAFPIIRQLFARVSMDDNIEANVSTFAAEMREAAFILRNIDRESMVIVDELGRGTSTRDGLAIALAIAEALIESRALVWFATHFRELSSILAERNGVVNLHLAVDMSQDDRMEMLYRIASGAVQEEHYGLRLAKVLPLPADVLEYAEHVSHVLEQRIQQNKRQSMTIVKARRRKLLLNLKEHLIQAKEGSMSDADLTQWLQDLQKEFVVRMTALDEEARTVERGLLNRENHAVAGDGDTQEE